MPQRRLFASSRIFAPFLLCTRAMIYLDTRRLKGCRQQQMQLLAVRSRDRIPAWRSCTCAFSPHNLGLFFSLISNWDETTNSPECSNLLEGILRRSHSQLEIPAESPVESSRSELYCGLQTDWRRRLVEKGLQNIKRRSETDAPLKPSRRTLAGRVCRSHLSAQNALRKPTCTDACMLPML